MKIKILNKNEYSRIYDQLNVHPLQTNAWAEVKSPSWESIRLGFFEGENVIACALVLLRKLPVIKKQFAYIPRGISIREGTERSEVFKSMKKFLNNKAFILFDSEVFQVDEENLKRSLQSVGFVTGDRQEQPIRTVVLDLTKSEDELMSDMRSKHRQYIRKAGRNGVKVTEGKEEKIEDLVEIMSGIKERKGYNLHSMDYYRSVWEEFSKDDLAKLFVARMDDEIVGVYMIIFSKDGAYEMYGGSNLKGKDSLATYALKWKCIKYAKSIGKKYYDQWGAEFAHPGLVQFKEGFGGKVVEYPSQFIKINNYPAYLFYKIGRTFRKLYIKIFNR